MLIELNSIKTVVDSLQNVPSTLSSILSKVNNLGSQKVLGIQSSGTLTGNSGKTFSGNGLLIINNFSTLNLQFTVGSAGVMLNSGNSIEIPVRGSILISGYNSGYLNFIWCTYA